MITSAKRTKKGTFEFLPRDHAVLLVVGSRYRYQKQRDLRFILPLRSKLGNGVIPANNEQRCRPGTTCPDRQPTCKFGRRCAMFPPKQYHGPRSGLQAAGSQELGEVSKNDPPTAIISYPGCIGPLRRSSASPLSLMTVHRLALPGLFITKQGPNMLATSLSGSTCGGTKASQTGTRACATDHGREARVAPDTRQ